MRLQWLVQQCLGGLRRIPDAAARTLEPAANQAGQRRDCSLGLTSGVLKDLLSGQAPVVICKGALRTDTCEAAANRLRTLERLKHDSGTSSATAFAEWNLRAEGIDAPPTDYDKLGYTKTDVFIQERVRMSATQGGTPLYLASALKTRRCLEKVFAPCCLPLDDIEDEISALPGFSCRLERCPTSGSGFLPCVVRRMVPGGRKVGGNTHMDTQEPGRTLSINIYLSVPEAQCGGELILYPVRKGRMDRFLNSHFFSTLEVQNFYPDRTFYTDGLLEQVEPIVYRPEAGDVVIIDPAYPHAVRDFHGSPDLQRFSLQTFLQVSKCSESGDCVLQYAI